MFSLNASRYPAQPIATALTHNVSEGAYTRLIARAQCPNVREGDAEFFRELLLKSRNRIARYQILKARAFKVLVLCELENKFTLDEHSEMEDVHLGTINGTDSIFWWESIYLKLLGLPIIVCIHWLFIIGKIELRVPTIPPNFVLLFQFIVFTCGVKWILNFLFENAVFHFCLLYVTRGPDEITKRYFPRKSTEEELEEQALVDTEVVKKKVLSLIPKTSTFKMYEYVVASELEKILFLYGSLREQSSWTGVISTLGLYARTHYTGSLFLVMEELINQMAFKVNDNKEFVLDEHGAQEWVNVFKLTHNNWKLATQNEGFQHMSRLISMLIGAGLVQATSLNCEVAGMKLFSDLCVPKFVSAFDLLDATMNCVVFFVEGGYECIQSGSLSPLLYGEKHFQQFDDEYMECKRLFEYARPGNYHMIETDENFVIKKLVDTIEEGKRLSQITKNPFSKRMIIDRVGKLQEMESVLQQHRLAAGVRVKPFCVVAYGGTGVGKSTIAPLLMYHILHPNGFDASDDKCVMLKAGQKHEEHYRTYVNGVYYDDFGNTKADFVSESPCEDLLDTVNTARTTARMAALELKNKVSKQPKGVVVSTNVKTLMADAYSEEPASITRRADAFFTFRVRPEFSTNDMLDTKKVEEYYDGDVPAVPDLWEIDVEISYPVPNPTPGRHATIGFKTVIWNGKELKGVDIKTALQYIVQASKVHFEWQSKMVNRSTSLSTKLETCPECKSSTDVCVCGLTHAVSYKAAPINPDLERLKRGKRASIPKHKHLEQHAISETVLEYVELWKRLSRVALPALVPRCLSQHYAILTVLSKLLQYPKLKFILLLPFALTFFVSNLGVLILLLICYFYFLYVIFISYVRSIEINLSNQRQAAWHYASLLASRTACILGCGIAIKIVYDMAQRHFRAKKLFNPLQQQGFMHPSDEEIAERDRNDHTEEIAVEHNWVNVEVEPLPSSEQSKTTTEDDLVSMCQINTAAIVDNDRVYTNLFFVASNVAIIPTHLVKTWENRLCTIVRKDVTTNNSSFPCYISKHTSVAIPDTDLSLTYIPSGGTWKDLTMYFPERHMDRNAGVRICTRLKNGEAQQHRSFGRRSDERLKSCSASGFAYSVPCYVGMCGAPVISQTKAPMIVGAHVAGLAARNYGFAPSICQSDLAYALEVLSEKPGVFLAHSTGVLPKVVFGKQMLESHSIHAKSPLRKLEVKEHPPRFKAYGSCGGRATYYSKVRTSKISKHVTQVCGVPLKWGKPKFHTGDPWLASLEHSTNPSAGVEPTLLAKASADYVKPLLDLLEERPNLKAEIRPLTRMENVCGIDGRRFIDKIPPNTAIGHPLTGPKSNFMTDLDPADFEGFANPKELDPMIWAEVEVAKDCWRRGVRYHPSFKACLKDEPTDLDSDKVRVYQAATAVLQLAIREYYLPIARFLSLFPKLSECAVGLNTMGPEWEEFQAHIKKYGVNRILAGDHSKYDLRMAAQLILEGFGVFIVIAKACGYSDEDITIMRGIATEVAYPTIAYNGDMIELIGSNPSGHNLTVYINSVVNSLLFRCAYFDIVPEEKQKDFRSVCALGTYGDDAKSSVKSGYDEFNHISLADFLAKRDMKFTMPDKTSTPTKYMNDVDADFLKRHNNYVPELKRHVGALDEKSIFKSLHANLSSKMLTDDELAATCIDGAVREWFFHGRDKYEFRRLQMKEIAHLSDISHQCAMLDVSFDEQVDNWFQRYLPDS